MQAGHKLEVLPKLPQKTLSSMSLWTRCSRFTHLKSCLIRLSLDRRDQPSLWSLPLLLVDLCPAFARTVPASHLPVSFSVVLPTNSETKSIVWHGSRARLGRNFTISTRPTACSLKVTWSQLTLQSRICLSNLAKKTAPTVTWDTVPRWASWTACPAPLFSPSSTLSVVRMPRL